MTGKRNPGGKKIGYIRVSSIDQNTDRQLEGEEGLDKVFTDKASGKDANRPQLQAALEFLREGDELLVHSMDRLARNVDDLRRIVRELTDRGVSVRFAKEGLTFTGDDSPFNTLMLTMLGAVAEFERSLIAERQREGIAIAKDRGAYKGRKHALSPAQVRNMLGKIAAGEPKTSIAKEFGISRETLYAYMKRPDLAAAPKGARKAIAEAENDMRQRQELEKRGQKRLV